MIIYFMQKWKDGTPTNFKEKILRSLEISEPVVVRPYYNPKLHTMRPSFRIKSGMNLDLAYWSGRPYHSSPNRFVEQTPCVSTQKVEVYYINGNGNIIIDGIPMKDYKVRQFALNDGFESVDKFFEHFNKNAEYNLIHWTDLRY